MKYYLLITVFFLVLGCSEKGSEKSPLQLSEQFKEYWFSGEAEITSYHLEQARYGELRNGEAVLIYVTEDFLPEEQVKANSNDPDNIPVLKLNTNKNFITGIYPYSIMQSCFYPLEDHGHAIKVSASIQEWCGQVYMQLNNRNDFNIISHSYFQGEADEEIDLPKTNLENELWTKLRVDHESLPVGDILMIPSFEFLRLSHKPIKAYQARGEYFSEEELNVYMLQYPKLVRKLKIYFSKDFPYTIEKWEESFPSGFGHNAKIMTTRAIKKAHVKTDYWNKNTNKDLYLREKLDLN